MIKCIAIDDEPFGLKIIENYCSKMPQIHLLSTFNNAMEAIHFLKNQSVDLVFLDIKMPDISGIEIAEQLPNSLFVIFTTAYAEYAVESYKLNAIDYLLKPFDFERFYTAVKKVEKTLAPKKENKIETAVTLKIEYKNVNIFIDDIFYLESMDNYVKIHTSKQTYMPQMSLKKALSIILEKTKIVRVHKSYAVVLSKIEFYTHKEITINSSKIPIGRSYLKDFLEEISKFQMNSF